MYHLGEESTNESAADSSINNDLEGNGSTQEEPWKLFRPFPSQTSTLIAGPSFLGKSTYVRKLIEYQHLFFQDPVLRVVVVNCNEDVTFASLEEPVDNSPLKRPLAELVQRTWEDFELEDLGIGDVLVIDDLQKVTERVREIVTAATHHLSLGHLFVVTHSVLGSQQYQLLNLVHRIALFCSSAAVANLASYVLSTRVLDPLLKVQLREALGAAQRSREVLVLELSSLPESLQPHHVACSHLLRLTEPMAGYAVVYPHPSRSELYEEAAGEVEDAEPVSVERGFRNLPGEFVGGSFLVLRPDQVSSLKLKKKKTKKQLEKEAEEEESENENKGVGGKRKKNEEEECRQKDEELWDSTVLQMESDVENFLPSKQWRVCKALLYEILHSPSICLLKDGRRIKLHERRGPEETIVSVIDYLSAATRRDAPSEKRSKSHTPEFKKFRQVTHALLSSHAPKTLFKNRLVLPGPAETRSIQQAPAASVKFQQMQRKRQRQQRRRKNKISKNNFKNNKNGNNVYNNNNKRKRDDDDGDGSDKNNNNDDNHYDNDNDFGDIVNDDDDYFAYPQYLTSSSSTPPKQNN